VFIRLIDWRYIVMLELVFSTQLSSFVNWSPSDLLSGSTTPNKNLGLGDLRQTKPAAKSLYRSREENSIPGIE
jgi:hypothetical protein